MPGLAKEKKFRIVRAVAALAVLLAMAGGVAWLAYNALPHEQTEPPLVFFVPPEASGTAQGTGSHPTTGTASVDATPSAKTTVKVAQSQVSTWLASGDSATDVATESAAADNDESTSPTGSGAESGAGAVPPLTPAPVVKPAESTQTPVAVVTPPPSSPSVGDGHGRGRSGWWFAGNPSPFSRAGGEWGRLRQRASFFGQSPSRSALFGFSARHRW